MADSRTRDVSQIRFTSTVFPTVEDMALWDSLSADEQRAVVRRDLDAAETGGIAGAETVEEVVRRVRAESRRAVSGRGGPGPADEL